MNSGLSLDILEDGIRRQLLLAELAETEQVRLVHEALEQLYRTQLIALELSARLIGSEPLSG